MDTTAFQVAKGISDNLGGAHAGFEDFRDMKSMESIFAEAASQGDEKSIDNAMSQILSKVKPRNQDRALKVMSEKKQGFINAAKERQKEQVEEQKFIEKQRVADLKTNQSNEEKQGALQVLDRMKEIRSKGNLGFSPGNVTGTSRFISSSDTLKDRGEYSQLGKSLISFATNIPIRNRIEFETLAEKLFDPSLADSEAEGLLNAMEQIISGSRQNENIPTEENVESKQEKISNAPFMDYLIKKNTKQPEQENRLPPQEGNIRFNKKTNQNAIYIGGKWILQ